MSATRTLPSPGSTAKFGCEFEKRKFQIPSSKRFYNSEIIDFNWLSENIPGCK